MDESARRATVDDTSDLAMLAAMARDEAAPKRGGRLLVDLELSEHPFDDLARWAADPDRLVLAGTLDGVVVGYAIVTVVTLRTEERLAVVDELFVDPGARGIGVGEAIMDLIIEFATDRGCTGVDSRALPGDRQTKNFFETFGMVARGIVVHRALDAPVADGGSPCIGKRVAGTSVDGPVGG